MSKETLTLDDFRKSIEEEEEPPANASIALQALWWAGKADWQKAHELAQSDSGSHASWVHAYLHRQEGDEGNAGYWYSRAGKPEGKLPF